MGKRKHSDQDEYSYIIKKIKKLEKKLKRSRRKHSDSSSSNDSQNSLTPPPPSNEEDGLPTELGPNGSDNDIIMMDSPSAGDIDVVPAVGSGNLVSQREPLPIPSTSYAAMASTSIEPQPGTSQTGEETPVDNTILELLGEDPSITKSYGSEINADLATRLQHIVVNGLPKDTRKELQDKYLPPSNCTLIDAPTLNSEIRAAITENVQKRDKGIELKQKQLGCAISCVGEAVSIMLTRENKDTEVIKLLMDASRLMCDVQNSDSITRRNFVLYNLKKDMKDQLHKTKIDSTLFGMDLAETIKTAKIISKSGTELKSGPTPKPPTAKFTKQAPQTVPQRNLNWKAPPQSRRQKGTQEQKEPAQRNSHANSSRPSYRPPPPKYRNRR